MAENADVQYVASLDNSRVEQALKEIADDMRKTAAESSRAFQKAGDSVDGMGKKVRNTKKVVDESGQSVNQFDNKLKGLGRTSQEVGNKLGSFEAIKFGAISGAVQELTRRFIELGIAAVRALLNVSKQSLQLAEDAENIRISLTNIFQGNQAAADAFLGTVDEAAVRLGVSRQELRGLAKSILPDVGDIDKTVKLLENAVVLGRDAGVNVDFTRRALEEAFSGNLVSLQRILNIPADVIDRIRESAEQVGIVDALIEHLGARVTKAGLDIESFADSFTFLKATAKSELQTLQQEFIGNPILESFKEQLVSILQAFDDHRDDIERVAQAFGEFAAFVVQIVGTNLTDLINNADYEGIQDIADNFSFILSDAQLLAEILTDPDLLTDLTDAVNGLLTLLDKIVLTAAELTSKRNVNVVRDEAKQKTAAEILRARGDENKIRKDVFGNDIVPLTIGPFAGANYSDEELDKINAAGEKAVKDEEDRIADIRKRADEREKEILDRRKERNKAKVEDDNQTAKDQGAATLERNRQIEQLSNAEAESLKATEEINDKRVKAELDLTRKLQKIYRDRARQRIEDEIKSSQEREDLARKNQQKIEDIERDYDKDRAKAIADIGEAAAKVNLKATQKKIDLERDKNQKLIDAEKQFQNELLRIDQQFQQTAEEAERRNDAQAFIAAIRKHNQEIEQAKADRKDDNDQIIEDAKRRREELKIELEREREDAKKAEADKLQAVEDRYNEALEKQRIANERAYEEQDIQEQRLREKRQLDFDQELEDFRISRAEKLADLTASLEAEYEIIQKYEKLKTEFTIAEAKRQVAALARVTGAKQNRPDPTAIGSGSGSGASAPSEYTTHFGGARAGGGQVSAGQRYRVGEHGPEDVVFPSNAYVYPSRAMYSPPLPTAAMSAGNQTNIDIGGISANVTPDMLNDPIAISKINNMIDGRVAAILRGVP